MTRRSPGYFSTVLASLMVCPLRIRCERRRRGHRRHRVEEARDDGRVLGALPAEGRRSLGPVVPEVGGRRVPAASRPARPRCRRRRRRHAGSGRVNVRNSRQRVGDTGCLAQPGCMLSTRIVGVRQSACPRVGEHHLHPLGPGVDPNAVVARRDVDSRSSPTAARCTCRRRTSKTTEAPSACSSSGSRRSVITCGPRT